jgi:serine/threonine-protein kinase
LRDEPQPISALQPLSPPALDALVATCLAKDPDERWQSAADVGRQLRLMQGSGSAMQIGIARAATPRAATRRTAVMAIVMLLAGAALATVTLRLLTRPAPMQPSPVVRFTVTPPAPAALTSVNPVDLDISRDGRRISYFAKSGETTALYVRDLDRLEARVVTAVPAESSGPMFAPDGASIVFRSAGEGLVRVALEGGLRSRIGHDSLFGATLGPDGALIYSDGPALYRIPASGGEPERMTPVPETATAAPPIYAAPRFLPDGRNVVYTLVDVNAGNERVGSINLDTREQRILIEGAHPAFERSGFLLFVRGTTLMAAPFDPDRLVVTGAAVAVVQGVRHPNIASGVDYSLSDNGTLVYVPAEGRSPLPRAIVWVDRTGRETGQALDDPVDGARDPRLSPDGGRLLLTTGTLEEGDIWVYDLRGSPPIPLITDGDNLLGIWSRDGALVAFMRGGAGAGFYNIVTVAADGRDRTPTAVTTGLTLAVPADWTGRGELILNRLVPAPDIVAHVSGEQSVRDVVATPDVELYPALSPDERWLAYVSNRTGRFEVWAVQYPDGNPIPVSNGGGVEPRWSGDGTELFFRQGDAMMAVRVAADGERPFGTITNLFDRPYLTVTDPAMRSYDVAPDGRFLMIEATAPAQSAETAIVVVQNFGEEIKRLMAVR